MKERKQKKERNNERKERTNKTDILRVNAPTNQFNQLAPQWLHLPRGKLQDEMDQLPDPDSPPCLSAVTKDPR